MVLTVRVTESETHFTSILSNKQDIHTRDASIVSQSTLSV